MKVCIVGAGAIGGLIGTRLAAIAGVDVSAVARGATLQAIRTHGWRLKLGDTVLQAPVTSVTADAREIGAQDLVVVAVKGPAMPSVAASIAPLIGAHTIVLPAMNGVPWWFGHGIEALGNAPLEAVDPGGHIAATIPQSSVIGCVVHASASTLEPGLVQHRMGQGLIIGEPGGASSERLQRVRSLLEGAGFDVALSDNIRYDIWYKLWGNLTMNPVSAITGATIDRLLDDVLVREFCSAAMREAADIGERIGLRIANTPEERHAVTRKLGAFRTSMLQDVEAHRAIELDAIVTAVHEMGRRLGLPIPHIDAILGLTRLFGRVHDLYPEA